MLSRKEIRAHRGKTMRKCGLSKVKIITNHKLRKKPNFINKILKSAMIPIYTDMKMNTATANIKPLIQTMYLQSPNNLEYLSSNLNSVTHSSNLFMDSSILHSIHHLTFSSSSTNPRRLTNTFSRSPFCNQRSQLP